jgi:hypothetical protein
MTFLQRKLLGIPILAVITAAIFGLSAVVWAATVSYNGSVTVVPAPVVTTYTFQAYDAATGGALVTDAFFSLGNVVVGTQAPTKTVWIQNTGTGELSVTATTSGVTAGTMAGTGTPVAVPVGATRVGIPLTFTAGGSPATVNNFTVTFTSTP